MDFKSRIFDEPVLEFGDKHSHPDPRLGLFEAGPLQAFAGDVIKVGVVGSAKTIEDTRKFLDAATAGFEGMSEKHPNLHPAFPGLTNQNPYRCRFEIEEGAALTLSQARIENITKETNHEKAVELAVDEIVDQLRAMDERGDRPHVAIVALPVALIERVWNAKVDSKGSLEKDDSSGSDAPNFRGMLKAKAMGISFPIQIVWEDVLDAKTKIPRKVKETSARKIQDPRRHRLEPVEHPLLQGKRPHPVAADAARGRVHRVLCGDQLLPRGRRATALYQRRADVRRAWPRLRPEGKAGAHREPWATIHT